MKELIQMPAQIAAQNDKLDAILAILSQHDFKPVKQRLTVVEAAELTGFAKQTLYDKVSKGEIPHRKIGGKLFFDREQLENWMDHGK